MPPSSSSCSIIHKYVICSAVSIKYAFKKQLFVIVFLWVVSMFGWEGGKGSYGKGGTTWATSWRARSLDSRSKPKSHDQRHRTITKLEYVCVWMFTLSRNSHETHTHIHTRTKTSRHISTLTCCSSGLGQNLGSFLKLNPCGQTDCACASALVYEC